MMSGAETALECAFILPDIKCATCAHRKTKWFKPPCLSCMTTKPEYHWYIVDSELVNATLDEFV